MAPGHRQPAWNPEMPLPFGAGVEINDQMGQLLARIRREKMSKRLSGQRRGRSAKNFLCCGIHLIDLEMPVEFDDRVHRAADQTAKLLLALAHLRFGAQSAQLGASASGKDLE